MATDALLPPLATIPAAATIRDGLSREPEPCWELVDDNGRTAPEAGHFQTEAAATNAAEDWHDPVNTSLRPNACWTATAVCGYRYDEEDEGTVHFATRDEAAMVVLGNDWRVRGGVLLCPDEHCEEC